MLNHVLCASYKFHEPAEYMYLPEFLEVPNMFSLPHVEVSVHSWQAVPFADHQRRSYSDH